VRRFEDGLEALVQESELIRLLRLGDPAGASLLVSKYGASMDAYARDLAPDLGDYDREIAVDRAAQKVVRRIDDFDEQRGSLGGWLRSFLRFELLESRRDRDREIAMEHARLAELTTAGPPTPGMPTSQSVALAALVLQLLTEAEQELLVLHLHERLTLSAIAKRLGPPPVTAEALRKRYERIKAKLYNAARHDPDLRHLTGTEPDTGAGNHPEGEASTND
jgi:RNA polymerase sigma factor (sigma-70 family)